MIRTPTEQERQAGMLLQARLHLVREVCEDLRAGRSPYPRLYRLQQSLEQDESSIHRHSELLFVEHIFGLLLGASRWDALARLERLAEGTQSGGRRPMDRLLGCATAGH